MARLHLTDLAVLRLKEPGIYYDTTTPAFGIRVGKNRKVWVITRGKDREPPLKTTNPALDAGSRPAIEARQTQEPPVFRRLFLYPGPRRSAASPGTFRGKADTQVRSANIRPTR